ncbi:MAG TPA: energy-coupled thiamine transporter ThiT [Ruminococcaceae bacterium]|nr:energy-coupled thiamine transporter ThiT [Oscillospiraceae bacterium]
MIPLYESIMQNTKTLRLVESALMIAIAAVLELVSKALGLELPFGGTVTIFSMLPIVLVSYRHGVKWGLLTGAAYSFVQMLMGFKVVSALFMPGGDSYMVLWKALLICLLDYVVAYTVLGFGGVFRKKIKKPWLALLLGVMAALLLRYLVHIISGAIFYGEWAEWFFTDGSSALPAAFRQWVMSGFSGAGLAVVYSVVYNGLYMIPEIILTSAAAVIVGKIPAAVTVKAKK